jgi:uncharacterized RDD family membrane protein YckC
MRTLLDALLVAAGALTAFWLLVPDRPSADAKVAKRRALHDFIAGTIVVRVLPNPRAIRPSQPRRHRLPDAN